MFYMYLNDDEKTVRAMDVLVPRIGEIIGGSQREDRYDVLKEDFIITDYLRRLLVVPRPSKIWICSSCWIWSWL